MKAIIWALFYYLLHVQGLYANEKKWIDYRSLSKALTARETQTSPCTVNGYQCLDCKTSIYCYFLNGQWIFDSTETCSKTTFCNMGNCTTEKSHECKFIDTYRCGDTEGMFPDPLSCKSFYYCLLPATLKPGTIPRLEKKLSKCSSNFSYNARTTFCDKPLANNLCKGYPVPECTSEGQTGALSENPTIYYYCRLVTGMGKVLFPYLDACKNGKKYNGAARVCQ